MATQYPEDNRHEFEAKIADLTFRVFELKTKNDELNLALMRKSAEASEAREKNIRCETELRIFADQTGHNLCWASIARLLKNTVGHTGKYPDPDNVSGEQFAQGCVAYHGDLFPDCEHRLEVVKVIRVKGNV